MKKVIFILIVTITGIAAASECQVVTRAEILNSGINRITDLLRLVDGWHCTTLDGFLWQADFSAFSGFKNTTWILMVNGQRIDMNFVGEKSLNLLPINIDAIDSVRICHSPQLYQGEFIEGGLIHIFAGQPGHDLGMCLRITDCNESGDPGPYRYTNLASENVDQMGPDYSATASFASANFFLRGMISTLRHPNTDIAILRRHSDLTWNLQRTQASTLSLQFMMKAFQGSHWFYIAQGASGAPILIDEFGAELFFFAPVGTEIPVANRYRHIGINGHIPFFSHMNLNYQITTSSSQTARPAEYSGMDFNWNMQSLHAVMELSELKSTWHVGASIDRFNLKTIYAVTDPLISLHKFFADFKKQVNTNHCAYIGAQLIFYHNRAAFKSHGLLDLYKNKRDNVQVNLAYSQRFFAEDNGLWFWKQRGYSPAGSTFLSATEVEKDAYEYFLGAVTWQTHPHAELIVTTDVHFCTVRDLSMESYRYLIEPHYSSLSVFSFTKSGLSGTSAGFSIGINYRKPPFIHQVHYELNRKSDRSNGVFSPFPLHIASYKFTFQPVRSFNLWAMLQWHSSFQWPEYSAIDKQTLGVYSSWIKGKYLVDAAMQKWLWHDRIRGQLLIRNLFNDTEKYHPLGASFNMRLYFQLELLLDKSKL